MNKASKLLLGEKDFGCFCKAKANNYTDICTVYNAEWTSKNHLLLFDITANRFLRNMVRAIVGTMLEVGLGRMNQDEFLAVLNSNDRTAAGRSVPSHGLYLTAVEYPSTIFLKNQ